MELLTLSYLQKIIYYSLFHADASLQLGSSVCRRQSTGGSAAIPLPGGQWRTHKYTIVHDVLFVVSYIKLNCFTSVYLIINLYISIFIGSPRHSMPTHTPAGEMSNNLSVHMSGKDPNKIGRLNAYIYFFQLSVPLIYIDFKFTDN